MSKIFYNKFKEKINITPEDAIKFQGGTEADPFGALKNAGYSEEPPIASASVATQASSTPSEVYRGLIPEVNQEQENAYNQYGDILKAEQAPIDEDAIRTKTLERFQAEVDALERVYAEKRAEEAVRAQDRLGSSGAIQARRGLLGSDFGASQTSKVSDYNQSIVNSIEAEKAVKISSILSKARSEAASEIEAKTAARRQGAQEYIAFLAGAAERKAQRVSSTVANIFASDVEVDDNLFKELADQLGVPVADVKTEYEKSKATKAAEAAKAAKDNYIAPQTITSNGLVYERQSDGTWKQVAGESDYSGIIGEYEYYKKQETDAGRTPVSFNDYQTADANRKSKVAGGGSGFDSLIPTPTEPAVPKQTFEEFVAEEEAKALQSFSPKKREELRKQFDELQVEPTKEVSDADTARYSFVVQQVIKGAMPASSILSRGTATERKQYQLELKDAEKRGLLQPLVSEQKTKAIASINDRAAKSDTYKKTNNMRSYADNVTASLSLGTGVGDISAINQYQKVIDEGAVTRDQDVKLIQGAQSLMNILQTKVKKLQKGEQLSPELRQQMRQSVESLYAAQINALQKDPVIASLRKEAKRQGIEESDTILSELGAFSVQSTPQSGADSILSQYGVN